VADHRGPVITKLRPCGRRAAVAGPCAPPGALWQIRVAGEITDIHKATGRTYISSNEDGLVFQRMSVEAVCEGASASLPVCSVHNWVYD
jgi:hypothetical protein